MNFLHYLYVKAKSCHTRLEFSPRLALSWPLWTVIVLFAPLNIFSSIFAIYIAFAVAYLIIYLLVLAIYPPKYVNRHYSQWEKKYQRATSLWFYLYFCSPFIFIAIRAYIWHY